MNITITKTTHPGTLPPSDQLGFGTVFTDHMFLMDYSADKGWHDARVVPYGPITMSPAASVLHYGTEVFEGMKAYRRPDGGVQLFRPWENVARLNRSCERLGLPQLDPDDALQAIKAVVKVDENWVPSDPGTSLYIRPFLYGTDPTLALHGVHEATFAIILSPSGSYFKNGLQPVPIMVETEDVRAVRGGTGEAKCGGNYGAANRAGDRAIEKGFSQVLWLDGVERKYVEEGGGMNVMFKINGTVVTPALTGSILRGVTRKSAIELLKSWGVPVEERLLSVDELFDAAASGALEEAWCIGDSESSKDCCRTVVETQPAGQQAASTTRRRLTQLLRPVKLKLGRRRPLCAALPAGFPAGIFLLRKSTAKNSNAPFPRPFGAAGKDAQNLTQPMFLTRERA